MFKQIPAQQLVCSRMLRMLFANLRNGALAHRTVFEAQCIFYKEGHSQVLSYLNNAQYSHRLDTEKTLRGA